MNALRSVAIFCFVGLRNMLAVGGNRPGITAAQPGNGIKGSPDPVIRDNVQILGNTMSFNLAAFEAKMSAIAAALPALGGLVQAAHVLAPNAAGLTKAGLVIETAMAVEPMLVGMEQMLAAAVTGIVSAYRSAGTLPPSITPAAK